MIARRPDEAVVRTDPANKLGRFIEPVVLGKKVTAAALMLVLVEYKVPVETGQLAASFVALCGLGRG